MRILKDIIVENVSSKLKSYRGIDPCEDTERFHASCQRLYSFFVTGASIRVRILKAHDWELDVRSGYLLQGHRSV